MSQNWNEIIVLMFNYYYFYKDKMASKTLLFLLGLTIIAVAYGAYFEAEEDGDEELTYEDFQEHFEMEKRGSKGRRKIGSELCQCIVIAVNLFLKINLINNQRNELIQPYITNASYDESHLTKQEDSLKPPSKLEK